MREAAVLPFHPSVFFFFSINPSGGPFLCARARVLRSADGRAVCNLYFRRRKHVRRVSRACPVALAYFRPRINPLFNTPLSARPAGKETERQRREGGRVCDEDRKSQLRSGALENLSRGRARAIAFARGERLDHRTSARGYSACRRWSLD